MKKFKSIISKVFISLIIVIVLILTLFFVKGKPGNPVHFQTEKDTSVGGPFESTNSNSRYALIEAMVERNTFSFTDDEARFSASDIIYYEGKYYSIFTPGVSFIGIPFYLFGKYFGIPQLTTYFLTTILAIVNVILVFLLARRLNINIFLSLMAGIIFLFATNSLAYALTFTQHQMSTTIILLALIAALGERTIVKNIFLGLLYGIGLLVDIPNGIILFPVLLFAFIKHFKINEAVHSFQVSIKFIVTFIAISIIPFAILFGWYNNVTTASPTRLAQVVGRSDFPHEKTPLAPKEQHKVIESNNLSLSTRLEVHGMYILLISDERGWFYFSPIVLLGLFGLWLVYKKGEHNEFVIYTITIILTTIVTYSMHGDPWGGWSFGSRYMIPSSALIAPFIVFMLDKYKKNIVFMVIFTALLFYSVNIAIAGALTSNAIPPKVEAVQLSNPLPYTYQYNFEYLDQNKSSSLIYNSAIKKYLTAKEYYQILLISILSLISILYLLSLYKQKLVYEKK